MTGESFTTTKGERFTTIAAGAATLALFLSGLSGCGEKVSGQGTQDPSEQKPTTTVSESVEPTDSTANEQKSQPKQSSSQEGFLFYSDFTSITDGTYNRIVKPANDPSEGVQVYNNKHGKSAETCINGNYYDFGSLDEALAQGPSYSELNSSKCKGNNGKDSNGLKIPSVKDLPGIENNKKYSIKYCVDIPDQDGTEVFSTYGGEYEQQHSLEILVARSIDGQINPAEEPMLTVWGKTCEERYPR